MKHSQTKSPKKQAEQHVDGQSANAVDMSRRKFMATSALLSVSAGVA